MPDSADSVDIISNEQLLEMILAATPKLIILDLRTFSEFQVSKIRNSVNFSIPSILKKRLIAGKIDLCSTIKSEKLKEKIISNYRENIFVLYNDCAEDDLIYVLNRKLKQDGVMNVKILENGFTSFRKTFPEWCEEENANTTLQSGCNTTEQLMGLRSLRISTPFSDSASSSSTDSSEGVGSSNYSVEMYGGEPVEILPGLYLGNASHSEDLNALNKYNIRHVLNVTPDLPNVFEETGKIEYLKIPISDHWSQDLSLHFPTAIKFIEDAQSQKSSVLVHCLAGVSRSVTITLAYLMQAKKLCLNDAFTLVRVKKPDVSPNFHFMQQLDTFERQLQEQSALSTGDDKHTELRHVHTSIQRQSTDDRCHQRSSKYSCTCFEKECKCFHNDLLGPLTGVSPDSGIEFDRWTPSGVTPK